MKKIGFLTIILVALASISFGQTPTTAQGWFDLGNQQMKNYKYQDAINSFSECLKIMPSAAGCYANRGYVKDQIGQEDSALLDFNRAVQLLPNDGRNYNMRGNHYYKWGKLDLALADFNRTIQLKPDLGEAYAYRGDIYFSKGDTVSAITDLNKSIQLSPKFTMPYRVRANIYCNEGKIQLARDDERKAIELGGTISKYCYAKGKNMPSYDWIQMEFLPTTTNEAAWELINEMLPKYPDYDVLYFQRAILFVRQKKFAEAKKDLAKGRELNPASPQIKQVEFIIQVDELAYSTPKNTPRPTPKPEVKPPTKRELAQKQTDKAESILNEGADLLQNGKVTESEAKLKAAFPEILKAIEMDETYSKSEQILGLYYFLFSMSPNDKEPNKTRTLAVIAFNKAISLDSKNAAAVAGLGVVFEMSGKKAEAKTYYQKALQINPNESAAKEGLQRLGN